MASLQCQISRPRNVKIQICLCLSLSTAQDLFRTVPWIHCSLPGTPRNRSLKFARISPILYMSILKSLTLWCKKKMVNFQIAKDKCCFYSYFTPILPEIHANFDRCLFLESVCNNPELIQSNIEDCKVIFS